MDRTCMVYGYRNIVTNKWYTGECWEDNEYQRMCSHKSKYKTKANGEYLALCTEFYGSIREYGWDSFEYIILEKGIGVGESYSREVYWSEVCDSVHNGYNCKVGGGGNSIISEESRLRYSKSKKGRLNPNFVDITYYESSSTTRGLFKKKCKRTGHIFSDFKEIHDESSSSKIKVFYYVYNPSEVNTINVFKNKHRKSKPTKRCRHYSHYEYNSVARDKFKKYCERSSSSYESFHETLDKDRSNSSVKKYFYKKVE